MSSGRGNKVERSLHRERVKSHSVNNELSDSRGAKLNWEKGKKDQRRLHTIADRGVRSLGRGGQSGWEGDEKDRQYVGPCSKKNTDIAQVSSTLRRVWK
jgi:hypothetical protein